MTAASASSAPDSLARPPSARGLATPTLLALVVTALVLGGVALIGRDGWLAAYGVSLAVAVVAALATLPALLAAGRGDVRQAGPRLLAIGMMRGLLILGLGIAGATLLPVDRTTTMAFVLAFYAPLLAAEAFTAVRLVQRLTPTSEDSPDVPEDAR